MATNDSRREVSHANRADPEVRVRPGPGDAAPAALETCPACSGNGRAADDGSCLTCGGRGSVEIPISAAE